MKNEFIEVDHHQWEECLRNTNYEFYQLPEFVKADAELLDGEPLAWYGEIGGNWLLIPLIKRLIPEDITNGKEYYDLVSPYGYPGLLYNSDITVFEIRRLLEQFKSDANSETCLSTFIRMNPILNPIILDESEDMHQVIHGQVICLNMQTPYEQRFMEYSSTRRNEIKSLREKGYTVTWNAWDELDEFISIYNETMERQEADAYYFFPDSYFLHLKEMMDDLTIELVMAQNSENENVAGALFISNDNVVQYHLSGTRDAYLRDAPVKLVLDRVIEKYATDVDYLQLGGGVGSQRDSLFKFKARYGKEFKKFSTLRIVNDRQRFNNLCQGMSKNEIYDLTGYFPHYRKQN